MPSGATGGDALRIEYSAARFCEDGTDPIAGITGEAGGTFSSTSGLVFISTSTGQVDLSATTPGSYIVTYTAPSSAVATTSISIDSIPVVSAGADVAICNGENTVLTATGAITYLWSTGETTASVTVDPTTNTTFTVTGYNGACSATDSVDVTVYALPTVAITGVLTYCAGASTTLTATAGLSTYLWSTGATTQSINVTAGSYTVTGTDSNGCSATSSASTVTELPLDTAAVTYSAASYCQMPTGALAVDGYYPLYTTESASNAVSSDGTSHTHVLNSITYYMPNAGVVIYHGTYSLTTSPTITGQSGTFNSPSGLSIDANGVIDKNASTAGTYSVIYTTNGSCPITVTNPITITALDTATFTYSSSAYCDNVSDPTPTKSATGTFSSSTGLSINSTTGEVDLDASTAGTYVIGFVTNGSCPNSSIQSLTVNAAPTVAITGTLSYCVGNSTTLTATAGLSSYLWSSGETTQAITVNSAGGYSVTGTDSNGCSNTSATSTVTELPLDNAAFTYSASSFEPTDADPTPTITGLTGGTFSAGSGLVFVDSGTNTGSSTGEIDLSASTAASYTITYDTTSSGSSVCPNTSTFSLAVTAAYSSFQMQFSVTSGVEKTITIPSTTGSSFTVDWGDGTTTTETGGSISHTYNVGGSGTTSNPIVSIGAESDTGPFTALTFVSGGSKADLLDVPQWGDIEFSTFFRMFYSCSNLDVSATDTPDLTNCTNFSNAFYNCGSLTGTLSGVNFNWTFNGGSLNFEQMFMRSELFNGDISNWNTSGATNFNSMFSCYGRSQGAFNRNLNSWDTSSVTGMSSMFYNQSFNGNISNWDTSSVTGMSSMFIYCTSFNQDIDTKDTGTRLAWDVSGVTNFSNMLSYASAFNQDISNWKIYTGASSVNFSAMFSNTTNFNYSINTAQVTIGSGAYQQTYLAWDTQRVTNMYQTFNNSGFNGSISNWDTSSATTMNSMFLSSSFNQPITSQSVTVGSGSNQRTYNAWDVSLVSDTFRMFRNNTNFNQDLSSWDVSSLSNIGQMFYSSVFNQNISDWNIINLSNGSFCFVANNIITTENYTDSIVGWAVTVYNNSGSPSTVNFSGNGQTFDGTRTSDNASGQTYVAKYGANWPSAWTNNNAQDAFDYLTTTLSWSIN